MGHLGDNQITNICADMARFILPRFAMRMENSAIKKEF
jgi:hypothetical protein